MNPFVFIKNINWYFKDLIEYIRIKKMDKSQSIINLMPYITDKNGLHKIDYVYFFQDAWAVRKIFEINPKEHVDVGSSLKTMSIVSQEIPVTFIDIRGVDIKLKGLKFLKGSILSLPFVSGSIESLSSICVVEHIGLGRYGDLIDPEGDRKAARELQRVLKQGGNLLVTVPVDEKSGIHFNAHRTFTREDVLNLFDQCRLIEEKYIYGKRYYSSYSKTKGFGTGLFHFRKKLK
ncbi:MAG: DUF268 domain-containing protein [Ignavibacteriales bacterium]|nr:DUF268 domain-containing protein [Ignavibacteriales bacterium]